MLGVSVTAWGEERDARIPFSNSMAFFSPFSFWDLFWKVLLGVMLVPRSSEDM
jgi:hypothetical protein